MASASLLLLIKLGQSKEGGLSQAPVVRVRAATSGLMSRQAFSQFLSLFSFLLHETGIINEKQRGAGRGSGGTELLACQTWAPTPKLEPYTIPALVLLTSAFSTCGPCSPLLSPLLSLKKES